MNNNIIKSLSDLRDEVRPERIVLIVMLCIFCLVGQFIIIYSVISTKNLVGLFGVSIDALAIWPINKLWQISKDSMAITMTINMIENADSPSAERHAMDLANQVINKLLGRG